MEFLLSIISGGATGLLGSAITGVMGYFKQKEINKQTLELKKLDIQILEKNISAQRDLSNIEKEKVIEVGEIALVQASMKETGMVSGESIRNNWFFAPVFALIDVMRASVRPALTIYLIMLVSWVYNDLQATLNEVGTSISGSDAIDLVRYIVYSIVYLCSTAVLWWFGSRIKATQPTMPGSK